MTTLEKIKNKVKNLDFGKSANYIQGIAWEVCPQSSIKRFARAMSKDAEDCDGMDGMLLNGDYYDWREFTWNKDAMITSFLGYFTDNELEKIAQAI